MYKVKPRPKPVGGPFGVNPPPPLFNPLAVNVPANGNLPKIKKIEKIYNCVIYEKFINEFKRLLRKY